MSITTKKGDDGFTSFLGLPESGFPGTKGRVSKADPFIECLGTLDELDAFLALCETTLAAHSGVVTERIAEVRQMLFRLMPALAGLPSESAGADIAKLEQWITALETENPIQGFVRNWTRPGAAQLNAARTICRRAERRLAAALESENALVPYLVWLNRLSDLLFLLAILEERHVKR